MVGMPAARPRLKQRMPTMVLFWKSVLGNSAKACAGPSQGAKISRVNRSSRVLSGPRSTARPAGTSELNQPSSDAVRMKPAAMPAASTNSAMKKCGAAERTAAGKSWPKKRDMPCKSVPRGP